VSKSMLFLLCGPSRARRRVLGTGNTGSDTEQSRSEGLVHVRRDVQLAAPSQLKQVTTANASRLQAKWVYHLAGMMNGAYADC